MIKICDDDNDLSVYITKINFFCYWNNYQLPKKAPLLLSL
jgi:hypothetical protein